MIKSTNAEEAEVTLLLFDRLQREDCLVRDDRETVAYRIAEIAFAAKDLYTNVLPRLINAAKESNSSMEDELVSLQGLFVHFRDLMIDYERVYYQALGHPSHLDEYAEATNLHYENKEPDEFDQDEEDIEYL